MFSVGVSMTVALLHQALRDSDPAAIHQAMALGAHPLDVSPAGQTAWDVVLSTPETLRRVGGMGPDSNELRGVLNGLAQLGPRNITHAMTGFASHRRSIALGAFHREVAAALRAQSGLDPLSETLSLGSRLVRGMAEANAMAVSFTSTFTPEQAQGLIAQAKMAIRFVGSEAEQRMAEQAQRFVRGESPYAQAVAQATLVADEASPAFINRAPLAPVFESLEHRRERMTPPPLPAPTVVPDRFQPK